MLRVSPALTSLLCLIVTNLVCIVLSGLISSVLSWVYCRCSCAGAAEAEPVELAGGGACGVGQDERHDCRAYGFGEDAAGEDAGEAR